jgi:hypothetical protein
MTRCAGICELTTLNSKPLGIRTHRPRDWARRHLVDPGGVLITIDDVELPAAETELATAQIGDIAVFDTVELQATTKVRLVRDQIHLLARRVILKREWSRADGVCLESVGTELLSRLLAEDGAAGVVGNAGVEQSGRESGLSTVISTVYASGPAKLTSA